jgi:Fe2+ or Zn2+ uptake regulation protein
MATISPPRVTWISELDSETSRKRLRIQAIATSSEAGEQLPGVSLPTIYATLELFEQLGIVRRVNGGSGTLLWDTRADAHHHMICRRCGRIEDTEVPLDLDRARRSAARRGFEPDWAEVVVSGLCASCRLT